MTELELEKALRGPRDPVPNEAGNSFWSINFGGGRYNQKGRERPITVANAVGRAFKGTHGNGSLEAPEDWPAEDAVGVGLRLGAEVWYLASLAASLQQQRNHCYHAPQDQVLREPSPFVTTLHCPPPLPNSRVCERRGYYPGPSLLLGP